MGVDVSSVPLWYHTLELPGGVVTPGWFDLRAVVDRLPWPDVAGKRCLDVATYDGFFAFEMERRGAREVVATDIGGHENWDWPAATRAQGPETLARIAGPKGRGFELAREAYGSNVQKRVINVYDLSPEEVGKFDVVVCGSLMLHLRDPVRALEAIRSVCSGWFMSVEEISYPLSLLFRSRPVADTRFSTRATQWWTVNVAGHRRMVEIAGFEVTRTVGPFAEPLGRGSWWGPLRQRLRHKPWVPLARRVMLGNTGVPHHALLARPNIDPPPIGSRASEAARREESLHPAGV
jgi:tRNA (mo5U34)-methyltransferase